MSSDTTLPRLLYRNAATMAGRPAMREKRHGIWQTTNWADYAALVTRLASGLAAHGFRRGDRLAVLGDNRPRLYASLLAAQALGGTGVPLWPDAEPDWLAHVLAHSGASVVVAENAEQVDQVLAVKDRLPDLALVLYLDPRGIVEQDAAWLKSLVALEETGNASDPSVADAIELVQPGDLALLLYCTDTADGTRGVMLSHANLLAGAAALAASDPVHPSDEWLAWMPMAWFGDVLGSQALALATGFTCNCPEEPATARRDLREIGPTILIAPPGVWAGMQTEIVTKAAQSSGLKRLLFTHFLTLAERSQQRRESGQPVSIALRLGAAIGELIIFAPLRDQIGLRRIRWANSGGDPLAPHVFRFFRAIGVSVKQSYGCAELAGVAAVQPTGVVAADTVGAACAGIEISIGSDGEVLVRGASVSPGYYGDPEHTGRTRTEGGHWRTGDAGRLNASGHLEIRDRLAHLGVLADCSEFVPRPIEDALRRSQFILEAIALGHDQPFVAAMIALDPATIGAWAQNRNIAYTSIAALAATPEVRQLIREEIRTCNADLAPGARVRRFLLLESLAAAGTEESLSWELRRHRILAGNTTLAQSLFLRGVIGIEPTDVPDVPRAMIEDVDTGFAPFKEAAHA